MTDDPFVRDVVLIGGGHAQIAILRQFGMKPQPGIRLTLIAREPHTPYSGMLPGYIAGKYEWEELHIDLLKLSAFANARFIADEVTGVDPDTRYVRFRERPPLYYDLLSINIGGQPGLAYAEHPRILPVKPIGQFIPSWNSILSRLELETPCRLCIVGGGVGSVELALAIRERHAQQFDVSLVTSDSEILAAHNRFTRKTALKELELADVSVTCDFHATEFQDARLQAQDGREAVADYVLWVAGVEAQDWIRTSGFDVDEQGFMCVDKTLRSTSHPNVFGSGDIVHMVDQPRPKSGVFAVRQGPVVAYNLRASLLRKPLKKYRAQQTALALIRLSGDRAVADKGLLFHESSFLWRWKNRIDRNFIEKFVDLPAMDDAPSGVTDPGLQDLNASMRCGGCGAKLGADLLTRVLNRLDASRDDSIQHGIGDDAAIVDFGTSRIATSCDSFRAMVSDPWIFGRIAAHHALNDLYAVGGTPRFALAIATIPYMAERLMEEDLYQTMAGALSVFDECGVRLVGGHSAEGLELSLGFAVSGTVDKEPLLKNGLRRGQSLILTKPIGTGVLLAGAMQQKAKARDVMKAIETMDLSNAAAANILIEHHATALTDITGFGLVGHVAELVGASEQNVKLKLTAVPTLEGAIELMEDGVESTLHASNERAFSLFDKNIAESARYRLLADPQTCGGLLGSISDCEVDACLQRLRSCGYEAAACIGQVTTNSTSSIVAE